MHRAGFAIIQCGTELAQEGTTLGYVSTCTTPPESPRKLAPFEQTADGAANLVTGEWILSGAVVVPPLQARETFGWPP